MTQQLNVIFHEEQRFRQARLWAILLSSAVFAVLILAYALPQKTGTADVLAILFVSLLEIVLLAFFWSVAMITELRADGIYVQARPIARLRRRIGYEEIKSCAPRTYSPIGEYGGWGIRFSRNGKAYNISGNRGVQLELNSGEKLLIGSQKADELAAKIQSRMR
jgi:hypothetical protein